jgi:hypothetical protein
VLLPKPLAMKCVPVMLCCPTYSPNGQLNYGKVATRLLGSLPSAPTHTHDWDTRVGEEKLRGCGRSHGMTSIGWVVDVLHPPAHQQGFGCEVSGTCNLRLQVRRVAPYDQCGQGCRVTQPLTHSKIPPGTCAPREACPATLPETCPSPP